MPRLNNKGRRSSLAVAPAPAEQIQSTSNPRARLGVLAAAQNRLHRESLGTATQRNVSGVLGAAPLVVESQRYEEWMKIATDNKITSTNTWNLALIDYFHDMSLLRNGDGDNSINFQKASCTLDGCVKIWTSRVDSVATETGKLLSGLGEEGGGANAGADHDDDDDDDEDGDEDDGKQGGGRKSKKRATTATLADDFSKLRIKSFDLEFTVDPLFKKTSADFDEGGAGGILMNHLGCDGNMKVVFDAGDAKLECVEEEDEDEEEAEEEEEDVEVDIAKLREKCIPQGLISLSSMHLTPSLSSFHFSADPNSALVLDLLHLSSASSDHENDDGPANEYRSKPLINAAAADRDEEDFGGFDDYGPGGGDDFGGGFDEDGGERLPDFHHNDATTTGGEVDFFADQFSGGASGPVAAPGAGGGGGIGYGAVESFDPRRAGTGERDLVMAMEGSGGAAAEEDARGLFEYFDGKMGKNWAGPEHWKMRRNAKKVDEVGDAPTAAKKPRKEKVPFALDFNADPPLSKEELFQPAPTKTSILLPGSTTVAKKGSRKSAQVKEDRDDHTLPEDYQFNSDVLLRLFLKPKTTLKMRRRGPAAFAAAGGPDHAADDVAFWAQAGAMNGAGSGGVAQDGVGVLPIGENGEVDYGGFDGGDFGGGGDDDDPPPFDTQWLASGDADEPDPVSEAEEDLAALTLGQLKRVKPETVNYAKRAKRIDVKKLKDTMWKELEEVALPVKKFPTSLVYEPSAPPEELVLSSDDEDRDAAPRPQPPKKEALLPVVSSLRRLYPKDKMSEISTSYMFICLLHLANEKGLRIQTPAMELEAGEDEGSAVRKKVGGLEALRVLKEVGTH
ncbi:hypothetical protein JCM3766R1_002427 [Sporobolomyces carnicolor]